MTDLKGILESNIRSQITKETTDQTGTLSGSNALLWNDYNFESESSDHCPRIALLRRVGNIQEIKSIKSYISNNHGRTFEDFLRKVMTLTPEIEFIEEEDAEVIIEDEQGNKLLTARPDKVCRINSQIFPVEVKTIQSCSSAYSVFIKQKPKLGALIQLAIYMYGHQLKTGYILYCASNWFSGFAGKTRWSVEPQFKAFTVEYNDDGHFYYNGNKSIVTVEKILHGAYQFIAHKSNNTLPDIPEWTDVNNNPPSYSGCNYCYMKEVCEKESSLSLQQFFNRAKEVLNNEIKPGECK